MKANQYNHQTLLAGQNWSRKITTGIHWLFVHPHKSSFTNHFDVWEILDGRLPPQNHYCFVIEYDPILDYDEVHIQMKTIKRNMQPCWWRWWNFPSMAMRNQSISYTLAKALSHFNTFFVNFATAILHLTFRILWTYCPKNSHSFWNMTRVLRIGVH